MFKIKLDGTTFCTSRLENTMVIDPVVTLEANKAGTFTFTVPPDHPKYDDIEVKKSLISVYVDDSIVFEGTPSEISVDFCRQKEVTCEGELAFLNDSVQRGAQYSSKTPTQLLTALINAHNSQVDSYKQFTIGTVTATGSLGLITNYETTMQSVSTGLVEQIGGYIRTRHTAGVRYIDYYAASPNVNKQTIAIGKNLIDLAQNFETADICTRVIPRGAKLGTQTVSGVDDRMDIKSVNSGLDYLDNATAQATYGIITKVVEWDEITDATALKTAAQAWLTDKQYENMVIEATAFDLSLADDQFENIKLLDTVRVVSAPHDLDRTFLVSKLVLNLANPSANKITLGTEVQKKMSAMTATAANEITNVIVNKMDRHDVKSIIESATGGTVYVHYNSDGVADELYILNGTTLATSTKWWRWNINGWAYTDDGGSTYKVAADMTGTVVASDIEAGAVLSNYIEAENLKITGGSVNITTSTTSTDIISLKYGSGGSSISSGGVTVVDKSSGSQKWTSIEGNGTETQAIISNYQYLADYKYDGILMWNNVISRKITMSPSLGLNFYSSLSSNAHAGGFLKVKTISGTTSSGGNVSLAEGTSSIVLAVIDKTETSIVCIPYIGRSPTLYTGWYAHCIGDDVASQAHVGVAVDLTVFYISGNAEQS